MRLPALISLLCAVAAVLPAQQASYEFKDPLVARQTFPVYPGAEGDIAYADLGRYLVAFMRGYDGRNLQAWAWHTEDALDKVKDFYRDTLGYPLDCAEVQHADFMKTYWSLFLDLRLPDTQGRYAHCAGPGLDLFSPVYNYALQGWESGTMILFHKR